MPKISETLKPRDIYWVKAGDTVREAVHFLCKRKTGAVAVMDDEGVVGVFSERDLMHRVVDKGLNPDEVLVKEVMSTNLIFIHIDDEIRMAKAMMYKNGVRHLLAVGKGNQLKGLVSMRDLIEADMATSSELIRKLNDKYYEEAYKAKWRMSSNRVIVEHYVDQP